MDQFMEELKTMKDIFIRDVGALCVKHGTDLIPLSFDDVFNFWNPQLDKLIDKGFRHKIERKIKNLKKDLNPVYRFIRKLRFW